MKTLTIFSGELGLSIFPHPTSSELVVVMVIDLFSTIDYEPFLIPRRLIEKLIEADNATK